MDIRIWISDDDGLNITGTLKIVVEAHPTTNLKHVQILIDDQVVAQKTTPPYEHLWDTTKATDGTHTIRAIAQYKTRKSEQKIIISVNNSTAPPPTTGGRGIGYLKLASSNHPPTNPEKYDVVLLGGSGFPWPYPNKVGVYRSGTNCPDAGWDNGVPIAECRANGWILKDANGNEIYNKGYTYSKLADVGNVDYRQRWCELTEQYLRTIGADGFYVDDTLGFGAMWWNVIPPKYPTRDVWDAAMIGFCQHVYEYFAPRGFYVAHNAGDFIAGNGESNNGMLKARWWARVGPYTHGLMHEHWMHLKDWGWTVRKVGTEWYNNWDAYRAHHKLCNGETFPVTGGSVQLPRPVDMLGLDYGTSSERWVQRYVFSTFLLDYTKPGSAFLWNTRDGSDPWSSDYTVPVGAPLGDATKSGNVWTRRFEKATVTVDPVAGTSSIQFASAADQRAIEDALRVTTDAGALEVSERELRKPWTSQPW